jgi:hypothetical protein
VLRAEGRFQCLSMSDACSRPVGDGRRLPSSVIQVAACLSKQTLVCICPRWGYHLRNDETEHWVMKKHEPVYNVYTYFEAGELRALGIKQYYRQGSDTKKSAFLQARATLDRFIQRAPGEDADLRAAVRPCCVGRPPSVYCDATRDRAKGRGDRNCVTAFAASRLYMLLAQ